MCDTYHDRIILTLWLQYLKQPTYKYQNTFSLILAALILAALILAALILAALILAALILAALILAALILYFSQKQPFIRLKYFLTIHTIL